MTQGLRTRAWALWAVLPLALLAPRTGQGQTTCEVNNQASCTIQDPTMTISLTISRAARLSIASTTVALPTPSALGVEGAPGLPVTPTVTIQSNTAWTVGLGALAAVWTATPGTARQNKPAADLQWNNPAVNGTFLGVTTGSVTAATGTATATTVISLNLRVRYFFTADSPGTYTLPLQLILTAP